MLRSATEIKTGLSTALLLMLAALPVNAWAALEVIDREANRPAGLSLEPYHLPTAASSLAREGSPFNRFSLQSLHIERGELVLDSLRPFSVRLDDAQTRLELRVHDPRQRSVLRLALFDGTLKLGEQVLSHAAIRGSDAVVLQDGTVEVRSDVPFDRIELSLMNGRAGDPPLVIQSLSLGQFDPDRGNAGSLACIIPLGVAYNLSFFLP